MTSPKSPITTHVLDTSTGRPAEGLKVTLYKQDGEAWSEVTQGTTNADGRITDWMAGQDRQAGIYRVEFETGAWFRSHQRACFYPSISIVFTLEQPEEHYHIPLLLTDYGYTTYRGS